MSIRSRDASSGLKQYDELVLERYGAMCASQHFRRVRHKWLRSFRKRKPFRSMGDWYSVECRLRGEEPEAWVALLQDVRRLSELYGIAPWQVLWALFIRDFSPRDPDSPGYQFVLDAWYLQTRLKIVSGDADIT